MKKFLLPCLALAAIAGFPPSAAEAWNYHPLVIGNSWGYENDLGETQEMEIVGEFTVLGVTTRVRRQVEQDQTYSNYWTRDASGNLFLHGARNDGYDWHVAYDPPLKMVEAPLFLGKSWVVEDFEVIDIEGFRTLALEPEMGLSVYFEGNVSTPAGSFYSYGLGWYPQPPADGRGILGGAFSLLGRKLDGDGGPRIDILDWYCENLGLSQQTDYAGGEHPLQLLFFIGETPILPSSWTEIKALY